jgi:DNA repair exonuclease SbcCD nuclease subunit
MLRGATRGAFDRLIDLALDRRVNFVVLAGDLYDGNWPDYNTGLYFVSRVQRLSDAGIPLVMIAGNHDAANVMTRSLPLPPSTKLLSADGPQSVRLDDWGVVIHGQSYPRRDVLTDLSVTYPAGISGLYNIGLLHTAGAGCDGHEPYAPCTLDGLRARQYQYWALGHVHQRAVLCEDPVITFSGNLQGRHVRETGPKGCWLVRVDERQSTRVEFEPLDVLRWERASVDLGEVTQRADFPAAVETTLRSVQAASQGLPVALRLELVGRTPIHDWLVARQEGVVNELRSQAIQTTSGRVWVEKVVCHTKPAQRSTEANGAADAWQELAACMAELRAQPAALQELGSEIHDLLKKLPADVGLEAVGLAPSDPATWTTLLDDVEAVLHHGLQSQETDA